MTKKILLHLLKSQKGQTSIFVALIFQVLFVLFAMALNIGMVVHDKVNLQNAVDLAAYYAAQRQAEWLNVIGHTNYQIRQSFKLFTFRYKVLGTLGMDGSDKFDVQIPRHPAKFNGPRNETPWEYVSKDHPTCIVTDEHWDVARPNDNLCAIAYDPRRAIPPLGKAAIIAAFNPANIVMAALTAQIQERLNAECDRAGAYSWYWSAAAAESFRSDQVNRVAAIQAYARLMAEGNPKDINGNYISDGSKKTFEKNLTSGNRDGVQSFRMFNSLSGIDSESWIPRVKILPFAWYIDAQQIGSDGGCRGTPQPITDLPVYDSARIVISDPQLLNAANLMERRQYMAGFLPQGIDDQSFTIGVEKNPWYMAYVGVEATTFSRPIFFPFGDGVELKARAFAKPFGGRIGPWYGSTWSPSEPISSGEPIDKLIPGRVKPGGGWVNESDAKRLPNHSKYPGDELGMNSNMALDSMNRLGSLKYSLHWWSHVWKGFINETDSAVDRLAWDSYKNEAPVARFYEVAAVAPDLFDITYYSIEPNFAVNYLSKIQNAKTALGIDDQIFLRPDLGYRPEEGLQNFSVQDQMQMAETGTPLIGSKPRRNNPFYFVRDKTDLLTSWMSGPNHGRAGNYSEIFEEYFGECEKTDDESETKMPGSCLTKGGRTGYSVKIISRDALLSSDWKIGGGDTAGALHNPPSDNEGWEDF